MVNEILHDVYYLCFLVLSFLTSPLSQSLTGTGIMLVFDDDDDDDDIDDGDDDDDYELTFLTKLLIIDVRVLGEALGLRHWAH